MATETFIGGYRNNTPNDPENWTPNGPPAPGDTALMNSGTMNIGLGQFTADILTLGQGQTPSGYVFNLFDGARLAITTAEFATVGATVNVVNGRATATFKQANPSEAAYTVNLQAGSTLVSNYSLNFGSIRIEAAVGANLENDGVSLSGGSTGIDADVVGTGSFTVRAFQGTAGSLEFGRSVATSETVELSGDPYRFSGNVKLLVDSPQNFHAAVTLSDGTIDLKNFGADSYSFDNTTLTLFSAGAAVDTLRLNNTTTNGSPGASITPLSVDRLGTDILISAGANPVAGEVALPVYQPPPPPGHVAAVNIFDTTTNTTVLDTLSQPYSGPVAGIQTEFLDLSTDSLNIAAITPNTFIHTGAGNDAIDVSRVNGNNILDGSTGSNFLVGGAGSDTFFVDARALTADVWSSVINFHSGDAATIFGVTPAGFAFDYENNQGAVGATGLTLHATVPGKPTASVTLAGYTKADLSNGRLGVSFSDATAASPYLYIHAT